MTFINRNGLRVFAMLGVALMSAGISGCGGRENAGMDSASHTSGSAAMPASDRDSVEMSRSARSSAVMSKSALPRGPHSPQQEVRRKAELGTMVSANDAAQISAAVQRKIIYIADVSLAVENLAPAQKNLLALVRQHGGYIAEANVGGSSGAPRTGRWKVRVPAGSYDGFMDAVSKVGEVQTISSNSQDVSEEFYDIEARLRNKRVEENRMIQHLKTSTAKLTDILQVEREISRVRGEIEQMQGRLRVLTDLTALTTITVTLNEIKDYVPPAPPTFAAQISRTFESSVGAVEDFVKGIILSLIAFAPWLVILLPLALVLWRMYRRVAVYIAAAYVAAQPKVAMPKTPPTNEV